MARRTGGYAEEGRSGSRLRMAYDRESSARPVYERSHYKEANNAFTDPEPAGDEFDLVEFFFKIWRHKGLIVSTVIVCMAIAVAILFQIEPRYTSKSQVMIEGQTNSMVNVESVMSGLSGDVETIQSEIEVIRSLPLIEKIAASLKLENRPEFNQKLAPKGLMDKILDGEHDFLEHIPQEWRDVLFQHVDVKALTEKFIPKKPDVAVPDASMVDEPSDFLKLFAKRLLVNQVGRSRVISIGFTSKDPTLSAAVVNSLAELYIQHLLQLKVEATQRANSWLDGRVKLLRKQVEEGEAAVERYRQDSGLIETRGVTVTSQQVAEISTQLIIARSKRVETEARLRQTSNLINDVDGGQAGLDILDSPLILKLREQKAETERRAVELSQTYGERHPKMISIRADIADIHNKIKAEANKIVNSMKNEVEIARARERTMERTLDGLKRDMGEANKAEVELRTLEREANASRALLETFLARYKETSAQEDEEAQIADARIISLASVPLQPSFPKRGIILLLTFVGSLGLGGIFSLLLELLDRGFRASKQLEHQTGIPVFSFIPLLNKSETRRGSVGSFVLNNPVSHFSEAIRSLQTSILLSSVDEPPKSILVTSSQPEEGKTVTSLNLTRMLASAGQKVLLIDADCRRPSVSKLLDVPEGLGLVDLLTGAAEFEDVLIEDPASGAFIITAGSPFQNPPTLLSSKKFDRTLGILTKAFDHVIIDSPPVLAVSDARIISSKVDITIMMVRWADTSREMVKSAIQQLGNRSGTLAGVALSMVDMKKNAKYSYKDSQYYTGRLEKYYTS